PPALEENPAGESSQVKLPTSPLLVDGRTIILERDGQGNYKLQDMEEAWKYDSLWLGELKANAELFSDMQLELQREPEESMATEVLLPTDTLKARLARLDEKTPFNIAYNPSLESVIKSFLTRRRDLMQRMITSSQFYFPLFEQ